MHSRQTRPLVTKDPGKMDSELAAAFLLGLPLMMATFGIMVVTAGAATIPEVINDPAFYSPFYIDSVVVRLAATVGTLVFGGGVLAGLTAVIYRYLSRYGYLEAVKTHHAQLRHEWELVQAEKDLQKVDDAG